MASITRELAQAAMVRSGVKPDRYAEPMPEDVLSQEKPSNPKEGVGESKVSIWALPMRVLMQCAVGMMAGGYKYGLYNYREMGVRGSTYLNACLRHLTSYHEGEDYDVDADAHVHNIDAAINCLLVMRDSMMQGNFNDDRPIASLDNRWLIDANCGAKALHNKYPDGGVATFTEKGKHDRKS